jgi:hypothetical protein
MARLNKSQRDTLLHQASLIDEVASQLEAMPCRPGWTRWPNGPHAAMAGVLRQCSEALQWLESDGN